MLIHTHTHIYIYSISHNVNVIVVNLLIEHAFHLLKTKLEAERPTNKLKSATANSWQTITKEETQSLVMSTSFRLKAVIACKGFSTKLNILFMIIFICLITFLSILCYIFVQPLELKLSLHFFKFHVLNLFYSGGIQSRILKIVSVSKYIWN